MGWRWREVMDWGRGPPPARTSTGLRVSGPTSGEGKHETCPYREWGHLHTIQGVDSRLGALPAGSGAGMTGGEGERVCASIVMGLGCGCVCRGSCLRRQERRWGWVSGGEWGGWARKGAGGQVLDSSRGIGMTWQTVVGDSIGGGLAGRGLPLPLAPVRLRSGHASTGSARAAPPRRRSPSLPRGTRDRL